MAETEDELLSSVITGFDGTDGAADLEQDLSMSARAGAEKPEQPLRLSCSRFGFLDNELRERDRGPNNQTSSNWISY